MGFLTTTPRPLFHVVATVAGKGTIDGQPMPRARLYVLEDRTAVLCLPGDGVIERRTLLVDTSSWTAANKILAVTGYTEESLALDDPPVVTWVVDGRGCNCGLGAVANAGPVAGKYEVDRVRVPEWHAVL